MAQPAPEVGTDVPAEGLSVPAQMQSGVDAGTAKGLTADEQMTATGGPAGTEPQQMTETQQVTSLQSSDVQQSAAPAATVAETSQLQQQSQTASAAEVEPSTETSTDFAVQSSNATPAAAAAAANIQSTAPTSATQTPAVPFPQQYMLMQQQLNTYLQQIQQRQQTLQQQIAQLAGQPVLQRELQSHLPPLENQYKRGLQQNLLLQQQMVQYQQIALSQQQQFQAHQQSNSLLPAQLQAIQQHNQLYLQTLLNNHITQQNQFNATPQPAAQKSKSKPAASRQTAAQKKPAAQQPARPPQPLSTTTPAASATTAAASPAVSSTPAASMASIAKPPLSSQGQSQIAAAPARGRVSPPTQTSGAVAAAATTQQPTTSSLQRTQPLDVASAKLQLQQLNLQQGQQLKLGESLRTEFQEVTRQLGELDSQKKLLDEQLKADPNQPALSIKLQTIIGQITRLTATKTDIEQKYARLQEQVRQLQIQHQALVGIINQAHTTATTAGGATIAAMAPVQPVGARPPLKQPTKSTTKMPFPQTTAAASPVGIQPAIAPQAIIPQQGVALAPNAKSLVSTTAGKTTTKKMAKQPTANKDSSKQPAQAASASATSKKQPEPVKKPVEEPLKKKPHPLPKENPRVLALHKAAKEWERQQSASDALAAELYRKRKEEYTEDGALRGQKRLRQLLNRIEPGMDLQCDAEQILLEIADGFIDDISRFAGELAKHRGSDVLTGRDVFVHLDRNWTKQLPRTIEAGRAFKAKYDAEYGKDEPVPFDALSQLPFEAFNMMEDVELLGADAPDALHLL